MAGVFLLGPGNISHILKTHYFFENLIFFNQAQIKKTESILMMTKEESTKIVNLISLGAGVMCRGVVMQSTCNILFLFLSILGHGSDKLISLSLSQNLTCTGYIYFFLKKQAKYALSRDDTVLTERQPRDCHLKCFMAFPFQWKFTCTCIRDSCWVENQYNIFV